MIALVVSALAAKPCVPLERLSVAELDAQALNVAGMHCYDSGDFGAAARVFRAAVDKDDRHVLAHFNLACALGRLRAQNRVCEHDAYLTVILDHLERSVALDEKRRARAAQDSDLRPVHDTIRFAVLTGTDLNDVAALSAVLPGFTLYGPAPGAYGHTVWIELSAGGKATWHRQRITEDALVREQSAGRWKVSGPAELTLEEGDSTEVYRIDPRGTFRLDAPGPPQLLQDTPDECSA